MPGHGCWHVCYAGRGHEVGRRRVHALMRRMGVEALYCKPNTSRRHAQHKIWPYLPRGMKIDRANQVFALDTTSIPMARGFVYLTAVVDGASRKLLAHRVAITLEATPVAPSATTSSYTTENGPIRAWRIARRTRHTSRRCLRSNRQHDCLGRST